MTDIPEHQIAILAATADVLVDELGIDDERAIDIAVLIYNAQLEAIEAFGPELTLTAAEVIWDYEAGK